VPGVGLTISSFWRLLRSLLCGPVLSSKLTMSNSNFLGVHPTFF
jgi:hypothetical protein